MVESLQLDHAPAAPLNWRIDGPMRIALKGQTAWQNHFAENAVGAGAGRVRRCPAFGERRLPRSTSAQLDLSLSVMAHLSLEDTPLDEALLRTRLAQLQLGADKVTLPLSALSGGERLKAALACVSGDAGLLSCFCWMSQQPSRFSIDAGY